MGIFTFILFIILLSIGLYYKSFYKDFNEEEQPLDDFAVALISDALLEMQLGFLDEDLENSNIIIAAKCEENYFYRFNCNTQAVTVEHVFKGESLKAGDRIDIARNGSHIYTSKDMYTAGMPSNDMGFVNEMVPGKAYLIFLDRRLETYNENDIIYKTAEFILAPIFCYEKIENIPFDSIDPVGNYAKYKDVKNNEFFIMSKDANEKIDAYKEKLFLKYPID